MTARPYRIVMLLENETFPEDTRVYLEATALAEAGYDVTVVCPRDEHPLGHAMVEGVRVYRYPQPWEGRGLIHYVSEFAYSAFIGFVFVFYILLRRGFDAIHVHTPPDMNSVVGVFFRMLGKKYVLDMHDLSPELYQAQRDGEGSKTVGKVLSWFERFACRWANRLIATNETQQRLQVSRGGAKAEDCYVVRNGPNEMFMADTQPREELRAKKPFLLGYVGMIGTQDGVDHFVHMLHELKKQRDDFLGVVVGKGPALASLEELAEKLDLGSHVHFTGLVPFNDVPGYIASFDICITPDPSNPYNDSCTTIKTMEYMALRKPTVSFATTENRITAGDAAVYAQDNSPAELARLTNELLDDATKRDEMGQSGRTRIERFLSWEHQQKQLIALYDSLSGRVDRGAPAEHHPDIHESKQPTGT